MDKLNRIGYLCSAVYIKLADAFTQPAVYCHQPGFYRGWVIGLFLSGTIPVEPPMDTLVAPAVYLFLRHTRCLYRDIYRRIRDITSFSTEGNVKECRRSNRYPLTSAMNLCDTLLIIWW